MPENGIRKVIQITITEKCNLRCLYCYEHDRNNNVMEFDKAKEIIRKSFNDYPDVDFLEFDFHGGEIALEFEFIKELCNWAWDQEWNKAYIFHATTNGTLIHGEIQDWFKENSHRISLGLSLDGTRHMHNINRSNSFDSIDLDFFLSTYPEQPVKMTISPATLPYVYEGIVEILTRGFKISANLAYGMKWNDEELKSIYCSELKKLAEWHIDHPSVQISTLLSDRGFSHLGHSISNNMQQTHRKWCGTGENMTCYSVDGQKLPCQMFNPSSGANPTAEILSQLDFSNIPVDQKCQNCPILSICPTCYGAKFIDEGKIIKCPDALCDYKKIETLASSYLYGKILASGKQHCAIDGIDETTKAYMMLGIKYLQDNLCL